MNKINVKDTVVESTLDNGVRIMLYPRQDASSAIIGAAVKSGSFNESEKVAGISHVIEHMLFKSTTRTSAKKMNNNFSRLGAVTNAFTDLDCTVFHAHAPYQNMDKVVKLFAEMMLSPAFLEEDWKVEKKAILEEIRMRYDDHQMFACDHSTSGLFGGSDRNRIPVIGTEQAVSAMTSDDIRNYWLKHYNGNTLKIVVVGHMDVDKMMTQLSELFGGSNVPKAKFNGKYELEYSADAESNVIERKMSQVHFARANMLKNVHFGSFEHGTLRVLNKVYGSGMSSRLFQIVREKHGLAYSIGGWLNMLENTALYQMYAGVNVKAVDKISSMIDTIQRDLFNKPIKKCEIDRAKADLIGSIMRHHDDLGQSLFTCCDWLRYTNMEYNVNTVVQMIEDVTAQDLAIVAEHLFSRSPMYTIKLIPSKEA